MDRLVLIDGNAFVHRAYHAYPLSLITSQGELVNAVYGFTSTLLSVLYQLKPKYTAVAFDKKGPTFRHKKYPGYKAHRPKMDKELINQFERIHNIVNALNIPIFETSGFEADDTLGTLAQQTKNEEVIIATGDRDILQLITPKIKVFFPSRGKRGTMMFDEKRFQEKYGFSPKLLIDFKALAGDASDDIPGVKGIGPKTAQKLIQQWGPIEEIYRHLNAGETITGLKESSRQKLLAEKKTAELSKTLAEIITNVPLEFKLKDCLLLEYSRQKAIQLFEELEFPSLIKKLPSNNWQNIIEKEVSSTPSPTENKNKEKQMELF